MEMTLSDSDVLIDYLNGRDPGFSAVTRYIQAGMLVTSTISRFEVYSGVRNPREREAADQLFDSIQTLEFSDLAALAAANLNQTLRLAGEPLAMADLLIAGVALSMSLPLLTRNDRHFGRIHGLDVVTP